MGDRPERKRSGRWWAVPVWVANLIVFGLLFMMVTGYFAYQARKAHEIFVSDALQHSRLVGQVVAIHARGAVKAREAIDVMLLRMMESSARFVGYLDGIEPFSADELGALARQIGLAALGLTRGDGEVVKSNDLAGRVMSLAPCGDGISLKHGTGKDGSVVATSLLYEPKGTCVSVAMNISGFERLMGEIGLEKAIELTSGLPGIRYVKVEPVKGGDNGIFKVSFVEDGKGETAEVVSGFLAGRALVVGVDAGPLKLVSRSLTRDFIIFSVVLFLTALLISYALYRNHQVHLAQVELYQMELAQKREEAALGRAAAAIAHEIRNPLNAMSIGLQRLKRETASLGPDGTRLIEIIMDSLERTNDTVKGLLEYARSPRIQAACLDLAPMVGDILLLYEERLHTKGVELINELPERLLVTGDRLLLGQVVENLVRNAVEAQPREGGFVRLSARVESGIVSVSVVNPIPGDESVDVERLFEPYYTTKTRGTGLGLAISRRIAKAHGGDLRAKLAGDRTIEFILTLPWGEESVKGAS